MSTQVCICLGAGGVGKTTCSTALALNYANKGSKVALISIDPAKRLADALGIQLGVQLKEVEIISSQDITGKLWVMMLDQKSVFDELVKKFESRPEKLQAIFSNKLYQAASQGFGGAIEYLALAKVQTLIDSQLYDYVIVDTPPDVHALDFLERPNILAGFVENKVIAWLIKPMGYAAKFGLSTLLNFGEKLSSGLAKITGAKALQQLAEFLLLMQSTIEGFHDLGKKLTEKLKSSDSHFFTITTSEQYAQRAAKFILGRLSDGGYSNLHVILNRCFDEKLTELNANQKLQSDDLIRVKAFIDQRIKNQKSMFESFEQMLNKLISIVKIPESYTHDHPRQELEALAGEIDRQI